MVVWLIGLSGAGKTTLANEVVRLVRVHKKNIVLLDGDMVREVFGNDLGHSVEDRLKNAWRICQLGKLLDAQGIHVVCAILSLFPETREWNRINLKEYFEVFIDTPLSNLIERDSKGIYGRYIRGQASEVAGMDLPFPKPERPDLQIDNVHSLEDLLRYAQPISERILGVSP